MEVGAVHMHGTSKEWNALPRGIRLSIQGKGMSRLRKVHDAISRDANLPMPAIAVEPYAWKAPVMSIVIFGHVAPIDYDDGSEWAAVLPASTLYAVKDDNTLRRLLCHEFCHCFWHILKITECLRNGVQEINLAGDESDERDIFNHMVKTDAKMFADPRDWFAVEDVASFMNDYHDVCLNEPMDRVAEWFKMGLPSKPVTLTFAAGKWYTSTLVRQRANEVIARAIAK